jgi:hypothetical protein
MDRPSTTHVILLKIGDGSRHSWQQPTLAVILLSVETGPERRQDAETHKLSDAAMFRTGHGTVWDVEVKHRLLAYSARADMDIWRACAWTGQELRLTGHGRC